MATGKALDGKPYAGNPRVRLDEGEFAPTATPRRRSLPYTKLIILSTMACAVAFPLVAAGSAALSADEKTLTISVDAGETWTYSDALPTTVTKIVKTGAGECSFAPSSISFTGTVQIDEGTLSGDRPKFGSPAAWKVAVGGAQVEIEDFADEESWRERKAVACVTARNLVGTPSLAGDTGAWGFARVGNTLKFGYMHGTTILFR